MPRGEKTLRVVYDTAEAAQTRPALHAKMLAWAAEPVDLPAFRARWTGPTQLPTLIAYEGTEPVGWAMLDDDSEHEGRDTVMAVVVTAPDDDATHAYLVRSAAAEVRLLGRTGLGWLGTPDDVNARVASQLGASARESGHYWVAEPATWGTAHPVARGAPIRLTLPPTGALLRAYVDLYRRSQGRGWDDARVTAELSGPDAPVLAAGLWDERTLRGVVHAVEVGPRVSMWFVRAGISDVETTALAVHLFDELRAGHPQVQRATTLSGDGWDSSPDALTAAGFRTEGRLLSFRLPAFEPLADTP
ncbi:hypothetical protein NLX86_08545 [Streptomyces sp. A3M-1-3]|uniref:hypothetical protein n=1 Tax=Streptomyces sp. A3M-1-3 TaxID=2962044 RepID=UPI0020B78085|nr:hypothetical protein [Streptomyces sp. A3M-1-3]MCP3818161.1 hypothetical protein [Streptomyces sp. A3M-1-3]